MNFIKEQRKAKALPAGTQKVEIGLQLPIWSQTNSTGQNSHPAEKFLALPGTITYTVVLKRQTFDPLASQINPAYELTTLFHHIKLNITVDVCLIPPRGLLPLDLRSRFCIDF